jgi:hypothetical protein
MKTIEVVATLSIIFIAILILGSVLSHSFLFTSSSPSNGNLGDDKSAKVRISDIEYVFDPENVESLMSDLFKSDHFSMFDVLVHLERLGEIELSYHFDDSMNTHVIDSLNGEDGWWYEVYFDGGWSENNVYRMDHYFWKEGTTLKFLKINPTRLEKILDVFKEEVTRLNDNGGKIIIPRVFIRGKSFMVEFENVEITPHNLRSDIFIDSVTTALDVILSLGDKGKITYDLKMYESIGSAKIVNSFWVEEINGDRAEGLCGFVYEAGSYTFYGFTGNHIHLPTDVRILNSPEYVEFYWICI